MPAAPSLLIVPYRSKTGKLYSQIPTSGAGDFTVTRNTEARRFNSAGLLESVASGIPRLDYLTSGGTAGCPALLVEPAGTNLVKYSEQFNTTTSGWSALNLLTVTGNTNATLDPAGGNTADIIVATSGSAEHKLSTSANNLGSVASGTALTWSVFAKATSATSGFVQIVIGGFTFSPASPFANFQLSGNGAVTTGTYSAASIQPFGNGWYRCSITATPAASGTPGVAIVPILASGTTRDATFAGNGVDGVYLWGAQLETGSVATSYIPTTAGTGSRSADVVSVSGAVSGAIGQTEGTIYAEVDVRTFASSAARRIVNLRVDSSNVLDLLLAGTTYFFNAVSGGTTISATATGIPAGITKIAVGYNSAASGTVLYVNGVLRDTKTIAIPNLSAAVFGLGVRGDGGDGTQFNDRIRAAALYTTRLTNAELAALTAL